MSSAPNKIFSDFVRLQNAKPGWRFRLYVRNGNSGFIESWFPTGLEWDSYMDHQITIFSPPLPDTLNTGCRPTDCDDSYSLTIISQKKNLNWLLNKKYMKIKATVSHDKKNIKNQKITILIYEPYEIIKVEDAIK
jgi:hypothetical protein